MQSDPSVNHQRELLCRNSPWKWHFSCPVAQTTPNEADTRAPPDKARRQYIYISNDILLEPYHDPIERLWREWNLRVNF